MKTVHKYTTSDIFEMLRPKLERYGLTTFASYYLGGRNIKLYGEKDVQNAIAIAYKSGYMRALKGRDFGFGRNTGEHGKWVLVTKDNLPPVGATVRYSRSMASTKGAFEEFSGFEIGDITLVRESTDTTFAVYGIDGKTHFSKIYSFAYPERWDVWVEE